VIAFEITDEPDEPDERTLEQTLGETQPLPVAETPAADETAQEPVAAPEPDREPKQRRGSRRFVPLLLLLAALVVAAVVLWVLAR
jgi:hypothetical protein